MEGGNDQDRDDDDTLLHKDKVLFFKKGLSQKSSVPGHKQGNTQYW